MYAPINNEALSRVPAVPPAEIPGLDLYSPADGGMWSGATTMQEGPLDIRTIADVHYDNWRDLETATPITDRLAMASEAAKLSLKPATSPLSPKDSRFINSGVLYMSRSIENPDPDIRVAAVDGLVSLAESAIWYGRYDYAQTVIEHTLSQVEDSEAIRDQQLLAHAVLGYANMMTHQPENAARAFEFVEAMLKARKLDDQHQDIEAQVSEVKTLRYLAAYEHANGNNERRQQIADEALMYLGILSTEGADEKDTISDTRGVVRARTPTTVVLSLLRLAGQETGTDYTFLDGVMPETSTDRVRSHARNEDRIRRTKARDNPKNLLYAGSSGRAAGSR